MAISANVYLAILIGVIVLIVAVCVPPLLRRNCPKCGARNSLDATECTRCHAPLSANN